MSWTIRGANDAAMNATLRTPQQLRMSNGSLEFQSLAADTFTYESVFDDAAGTGVVVPEEGQVIQLYRSGERRFRGHVTRVEPSFNGVSVEVQGPWWWMQKILLTGNQTDGQGTTDERAMFVFNSGPLRTSFLALMNRMAALGVPLEVGSVAAMYDFTRLTLSNVTCAAALTRLMQCVPDAVAQFDYTGADFSNAILRIARRNGDSAMETRSFDIGTDRLALGNIRKRTELEVTRVILPYMDRNPQTGMPRFQRQGAGTAETGKLQIITVSGPEIVNFLPKDDFQSASIQTVGANQVTDDFIASNDTTLAGIKKQYGITGGRDASFTTYSGDTTQGGSVRNLVTTVHNFPGLEFQRDNGSYVNNLSGRFLVVSQDLPQWAKEQWNGIEVTITGTWIAYWTYETQGNNFNDRFGALRAGAVTGSGFFTSNLNSENKRAWAARPFSCRGVLMQSVAGMPDNPPWASPKVVYKKWDYEFLSPPAGMAAGLRDAQNWVPREGEFSLAGGDVSGLSFLNKAINITGGLPHLTNMRAMVKTLKYDLLTGKITYKLGAPARTNLATAMGRVELNPQDVVEYIS